MNYIEQVMACYEAKNKKMTLQMVQFLKTQMGHSSIAAIDRYLGFHKNMRHDSKHIDFEIIKRRSGSAEGKLS